MDKPTQSVLYDFYTGKFFVSIIFTPIACMIGFLLNYLIIRTIKNNEKELKEGLFIYMAINSRFNCAYCLIYMLNLLNECLVVDSVYCP
jgi:hypothetical protein